MEKIWFNSYQSGVPHEINPDEFSSLADLFDRIIDDYGDNPAFSNMDTTISYNELDELSQAFACYLLNDLRLKKGDRVALMMPNCLQYPIALFGILRAGLVVVNVNPMYTARELEHQLNDAGAETIVIMRNFANTLTEVAQKTSIKNVILTDIGDCFPFFKRLMVNFVVKYVKKMIPAYNLPKALEFRQVIRQGKQSQLPDITVQSDDMAFLQYTGGTTGIAKGAILTHRNMVANVLQVASWLKPLLEINKETIITPLPLYHIFSLTANCLTFMKFGGHNVLITNPRDMAGFVKTLKNTPFTVMTGVNTLFNGLLNTPSFAEVNFNTLKLALGGGMAVQEAVAKEWKKVTGHPLSEGYGLTETSPVVCINPMNLTEYNHSIGLPVASTEVCIQDEQGQHLGIDERGELCVRGPQVMKGYWQRPEATAEIIDNDGWLHTGDIAIMNDKGFLRIVDRKKDMILVSGFNVFPNEIEDVVAAHASVLEVAAIGVPHQVSGEVVKVFIVTKDGQETTSEEIRQHCKAHLTGYKVPKLVEFRDSLPKSNVGKILRKELRAE